MILVVALICSSSLTREQCTPDTARAVLSFEVDRPTCAGVGAVMFASEADEYVRVRCVMK